MPADDGDEVRLDDDRTLLAVTIAAVLIAALVVILIWIFAPG